MQSNQDTEAYLALRREEASRIDPATAEVAWWYAQTLDPYGIHDVPDELSQVGREYFCRRTGSETWVHFDDLPAVVRDALWERHKHTLAYPAGLEGLIGEHARGDTHE